MEIGSAEDGFTEDGFIEVGTPEIGTTEVGTTEVGIEEVSTTKVSITEVGITEVGVPKIRTNISMFNPPCIPDRYSLLQEIKILSIRHETPLLPNASSIDAQYSPTVCHAYPHLYSAGRRVLRLAWHIGELVITVRIVKEGTGVLGNR
jgi:hypothetical protein